jgi:hypothetical protein
MALNIFSDAQPIEVSNRHTEVASGLRAREIKIFVRVLIFHCLNIALSKTTFKKTGLA